MVGGGLRGVDDQLGELGVDRNKTLIGVKTGFKQVVSGVRAA